MVKFRISILVSLLGMPWTSNLQSVGKNGEEAIGGDDGRNPCDDRPGCRLTDGSGAVARLHTSETAGEGHEESEERAFANPQQKALELNSVHDPGEVDRGRNIQHAEGHGEPAGDAD